MALKVLSVHLRARISSGIPMPLPGQGPGSGTQAGMVTQAESRSQINARDQPCPSPPARIGCLPLSPDRIARIPMSASNEITAFFSPGAIPRAIVKC
jgi:hypothetical protein